ncbi:ATP-binding protein [Clostridium sp. YIM B02505]|uniref:ATP-binding protein n=1 Tax=Clostridium yunnanense TaxID=2800325 RepID=A0ABS1ERY3_9CLOT|nr:ATP-binding protein [Clostridium yunnanense]MBK1812053.1 ATP-binding protein [Clostridium yunnanense]
MKNVQITSDGIKKALSKYKPYESINEYIWNGFDADSTTININCKTNEFNSISWMSIQDNGVGIDYNSLNNKFTPFFQSQKALERSIHRKSSDIHGKNGVGRLTFFNFSKSALWNTIYIKAANSFEMYDIVVDSSNLSEYIASNPTELEYGDTGTRVEFSNIIVAMDIENLRKHITQEFAWFLKLNDKNNYKIILNNKEIEFNDLVADEESLDTLSIEDNLFEVDYIRWSDKPVSEFSYFYFLDSNNNEAYKETTKFNKKGDSFYHSMYIKSSYFDNFTRSKNDDKMQISFLDKNIHDDVYQSLIEKLNEFLKEKRKPFLHESSVKVVQSFEKDDALPKFNVGNKWEMVQKEELTCLIAGLYQVEPRIFSNLNTTQKKTLAHLLNLIMDSGEKDNLFTILEQIVELDPNEREEFAHVLNRSSLSSITKTIKLIEDRVKAINQLQELIFNEELKANERDHLQKFIENHYWIFGEEYALAAAAEDKFEKVLKSYNKILTKNDSNIKIDHESKNKEMDICMVRQNVHTDTISNIVVELKAPWVRLGKEQLDQVIEYMDVITSVEQFNDRNQQWVFILIGNKLSSKGWIERYIENAKSHGKRSLVFKANNYEIYVKTWSEVINEFEMRHRFLLDKLKLKREKLYESYGTAAEVIEKSKNTASY